MFNQYVLILVWIGFMAFLQGRFYREEYNELTGKFDWRVAPTFAFIVVIPLIWMAATRGNEWGDTAAYRNAYFNMPSSVFAIPEYIKTISKDRGFKVLAIFIKEIIGNQDKLYFGVLALIQLECLRRVYRKYSIDYVLAVFFFVASTDYLSWMHNGIRQFLAVTLIFAATPYILKGKKVYPIVVVLIASTLHQSALLMIPIIFIAQGEAWNKKTIMMLAAVFIAAMCVDQFTDIMDEALSSTQYVNVVRDYTVINDDGTNPIRALFYAVPTIIALWKKKEIAECNDRLINLCVNMSIASTGLYIISVFTSGIFIGRLPIYASLYNYILLPWEIEYLFGKKNNKIVLSIVVVVYILFYAFQLMTWGML